MTGEDCGSAGPTDEIVRGLPEYAPAGWHRLVAWFAVTTVSESAVLMVDDGTQQVRCAVSEDVWDAVRRHRQESATSDDGPWWRLMVRLDTDGVETACDYGAEPFPGEQLFAPEAYLADLERYPRTRLPAWLAAYIGRGSRSARTPQQAAAAARADSEAGVRPAVADGELPDLRVLWARWAVLAAAFLAAGSELGPRIGPSVGVFEGESRSGSTLTVLPGDRAVLSGGVWDAPVLDAVYNAGAGMPEFFAGAPSWVADPVLNPRIATGMLTFCYWWQDGRWYRGESEPMARCAPAVPAVWTVDTVAGVVADLLGEGANVTAAAELVRAAQGHSVTRAAVERAFGHAGIDIEGALFQFTVAGLVADGGAGGLRLPRDIPSHGGNGSSSGDETAGLPWVDRIAESGGAVSVADARHGEGSGNGRRSGAVPKGREDGTARAERVAREGAATGVGETGTALGIRGEGISESAAIDLVRAHIREQGYETTGYPLSTLRADRVGTVWVVHSPVPAEEIALDRAVFYVAADGEVERSTSSVPWSEYVAGVEQRLRRRRDGRDHGRRRGR
ncbi:hypothetical protein [Nocardia donostiensis]|uniref:Uncharacterized protein n=1 Tax=Nocardia donostiensis TaxID=1538463 RepID=A0A1V2TG87_9NOCA|nr:hypothetical protein [Nocardia donostiensis]ONM48494.1 hypothetical protein B0T46_12415 [Nocardia donostiensis]OQS16117.1 hypothetical protein B0T36_04785 [Nocardia donostiensis]OQS18985.1 hypothetical protein B0T44_16605 [Nocardia donostiensis]